MHLAFTNSFNVDIVFLLLAIIIIAILLFLKIYEIYVSKSSNALKKLSEINRKYNFYNIPKIELIHKYDNEAMYKDIFPEDYLIYELQFKKNEIKRVLENTKENKILYDDYFKEISNKCILGSDVDNVRLKFLFLIYEKRLFKNKILKPKMDFTIFVRLILTNINGAYKTSKYRIFLAEEIYDLIYKLNKKNGSFYLIPQVWESICRVERGKVSNKMRFSIYKRDNYRCRKCGRRTDDLEIDHIYPIAKGGKSTYDNLQTLCKRCNKKKGANIE